MKKAIKILIGTVFLICILAGLGYLGLAVYYENGFSFMTYINGIYCTGKSVEAVNYELNEAYDYEGLTVVSNAESFYIPASEIAYSYDYKEPLNHYLSVQNPYLWGENLTEGKKEYTLLPAVCYDKELLDELISPILDKQVPKEKIEVSLELTQEGFVIKDNKQGLLDTAKAKEAIIQALLESKDSVNLMDAGCYYDEPYTADEETILSFYKMLDTFQKRKVSYIFDKENETFASSDLVKTLLFYNAYSNGNITEQSDLFSEYTDEYGNLLIDEENVSALLDEKLEPYNTYQNHIFTTHDGRELQIKGGTYGNKIAMKNEKKELLTFLQSEKTEFIRTPEYTKEAPIKGINDIGDTYIEVDIGQQKMFYYRDGELFIETDVVTGRNNATREEVCYVYSKQKNRILRGPGYESFVYYWMPVSGGIGIHDATWRSKFGGEIYIRDGSHGCVNTPLEIVEQMYEVMEVGTPCILYYGLEEDE